MASVSRINEVSDFGKWTHKIALPQLPRHFIKLPMSIDKQSSKMAFVCDVCGTRFEAEDTINNRPELNALWIAAKELGWRTRQQRRGKWHTPGVRDRRLETVELVAKLQFRQTIPILPLSSRGG